MPVLEDLGSYLQAQGFGTMGVDIFLATFPEDSPSAPVQDALLALFEVPGLPPRRVHDIQGPAVDLTMVALHFRGAPYAYPDARTKAGAAYRLLDCVVNQTVNGVWYERIEVMESPYTLPADEYHRPFVVFNVLCSRDAQAP